MAAPSTDLQRVCHAIKSVYGRRSAGLAHRLSCRVTITYGGGAAVPVVGHFHEAGLISPVFFYFLGGGVGAYQMQNSTPAVPKHPQWVQISLPLLRVL